MWGIAVEILGRIDSRLRKIPKSWKHIKAEDKRLISRIRKSCRPFNFGVEGVFSFKRNTLLKFFQGIVKGTFKALLTIGK